MLFLDTNAIIGYLADDLSLRKVIDEWGVQSEEISIATIVVVEVLSYSALTDADRQRIDGFLEKACLVDLTPAIAREAAELRRTFNLTTADAVIAATALAYKAPLVSRDRIFTRIQELKTLSE